MSSVSPTQPSDTPGPDSSETAAPGVQPIDYAAPPSDGTSPKYVDPNQVVTAKAGTYYRNTRYIMSLALFAFGLWFGYDGFVKYPAQNAELKVLENARDDAAKTKDETQIKKAAVALKNHPAEHTDMDLLFQRALLFALPPLSIALLAWTLHNSRGKIHYENGVVNVPGHPPVPLDAVRSIDKRLWDRKGIALIDYETTDGKSGTLRLDDFVYDRPPIDKIYDIINAHAEKSAKVG